MLPEAELLVMAEQVLVEVLGRIRPEDEGIVLPLLHAGAEPVAMAGAVERHLRSEAALVEALAPGSPLPGSDGVAGAAAAVVRAARAVADGEAVVGTASGDAPVRALLVRATLERSLLAHYVAAYLGSTACPLPEELARPLHELTAPEAETWRRAGWFREPMPLPDHVSQRDRFLLSAGHEPHPLGH